MYHVGPVAEPETGNGPTLPPGRSVSQAGAGRPCGYFGWFSKTSRPSIFGDTVPSCEM